MPLIFEKASSMGLRSGEYGGKNPTSQPLASTNSLTRSPFHEKTCQRLVLLTCLSFRRNPRSSFHPRPPGQEPNGAFHLWDPRLPSLVRGASALRSPRGNEGSRGPKGFSGFHPLMSVAPSPGFQRSSYSRRSVHTVQANSASFLAVAVLASFAPRLALILW